MRIRFLKQYRGNRKGTEIEYDNLKLIREWEEQGIVEVLDRPAKVNDRAMKSTPRGRGRRRGA